MFYPGDVSSSIRYTDSDAISVDRIRVLGGRTLHWNAVVLRYAPPDFQQHSVYGIEEDWPLTYQQLESGPASGGEESRLRWPARAIGVSLTPMRAA